MSGKCSAIDLPCTPISRYPTDNCAVAFPNSGDQYNDPQTTFPTFLTHQSGLTIVSEYLNSTNFAQSKGKELLMFETNTASCGGFPGISDSFGAALWGVDYALQMAAVNFSGSLFHVGGQSVAYNPFTREVLLLFSIRVLLTCIQQHLQPTKLHTANGLLAQSTTLLSSSPRLWGPLIHPKLWTSNRITITRFRPAMGSGKTVTSPE